MAQTTVSFRMDSELKQNFDDVCNELGLNMTTAFTILAKKVTREHRIPFDVSIDPFYSATNQAALSDSIAQYRSGKTVVKTMEQLEQMADE
jgi:DNA-damage-inducible protein J